MDGENEPQIFLDRTLDIWRRRASVLITREDARRMAENVAGFFHTLIEWEASRDAGGDGSPRRVDAPPGSTRPDRKG